ncbi:MAG: AraC family transcriptional regulator [Microbacterium sp.]|jgi:AraC-like DNA-binding protein|uniref:AraC family transcriptional regulator n=1 Tax=Microbacterium sp. TaxID=51671 RepID=UPI0028380714|nr:AraC family transcriptional regulator [Microbacterium sp.]MDR2320218.1 AraC family transcriptional regulator [Microbacterium sp.]
MQITSTSGGAVVSGYLDDARRDHAPGDAVVVRPQQDPYRARSSSWALGRLLGCDIRDEDSVSVRPLAFSTALDAHFLGILLEGSGTFVQNRSETALRPGSMVLYSRSAPFFLDLLGPYRYLVLAVDVDALGASEQDLSAVAGSAALSDTTAACILTGLLAGVPERWGALPAPLRLELADVALSLLRDCVREARGERPVLRSAEEIVYDRVVEWIEVHLADPDLSPARIAEATHISVSYLHRVFRRTGTTVGEHVLARRVEGVRRELQTASGAESLAAVGRRWGFRDPSRLSKVVRQRFGRSPRELRAEDAVS